MRASTERTLTTVFTLGILGVGAWWAWRNVLPAIARGLKTTPTTPTQPATPLPTGTPAPDLSFLSETAKALSEAMSLAFRNGFSGPGTQVLVDQAKDGVSPSSEVWWPQLGVTPTAQDIAALPAGAAYGPYLSQWYPPGVEPGKRYTGPM